MYPRLDPPDRRQPLTRKEFRAMHAAINRSCAPGREDRIAVAQAKRDRKNAKRAADHA